MWTIKEKKKNKERFIKGVLCSHSLLHSHWIPIIIIIITNCFEPNHSIQKYYMETKK
jgi:hypothetical protein